jgi:hypothetical protein
VDGDSATGVRYGKWKNTLSKIEKIADTYAEDFVIRRSTFNASLSIPRRVYCIWSDEPMTFNQGEIHSRIHRAILSPASQAA